PAAPHSDDMSHISTPHACILFFFTCSGAHRDLHSFPTRRSSDLYYTVQIGRQPMLMVRGAEGRISVLYNRCPHRGNMMCGDRHGDRKSTRLNSSHLGISYAVFCLKKKTKSRQTRRPHTNTSGLRR